MKHLLYITILETILASCQADEFKEIADRANEIFATIEEYDASKTIMDEYNNILWSTGDQIILFKHSTLGLKYQIQENYIGCSSGYFSKVTSGSLNDIGAGTEIAHNIAYYPYSDNIQCRKSGSSYELSVQLPSEQTYTAESFGNRSFPMIAISNDNNIIFNNVCGGIKLQFKGTQKIASIKIEGNNNEKLSGAAIVTSYVDGSRPYIKMSSEASSSATLRCEGVQLRQDRSTEFIITLPPVVFTKGFKVTITDSNGSIQTISTDKSNEIKRSSIMVMPQQNLESSSSSLIKVDYIDEYNVNHGKGVEIDGIVWAPVNCGYNATLYPYGLLYQWGRKHGQGYSVSYEGSSPVYENGPVSIIKGENDDSSNVFFWSQSSTYDWITPQNDHLWNLGTDDSPIKTEYDPCPNGWRVPTYLELNKLQENYSPFTTDASDIGGRWLSGTNQYQNTDKKIFLIAAGGRYGDDSIRYGRDYEGNYWSSKPNKLLSFESSSINMCSNYSRACGYSVRCVQDDAELIAVSSLTLSQTSLSIKKGNSTTLSATIVPSDANHKTVYWSSDDSTIADVDENGKITAVSNGTTIITAMTGMQTATCTVTVYVPTISVTLNKTELTLDKGEVETLIATVTPEEEADQPLTWVSSNTSVASVNQSGKVRAINYGRATITAKYSAGIEADCLVIVPHRVTSITLDKSNLRINQGDVVKLTAEIEPSNATNKAVTWTSDNTGIVSVDQSGYITGINPGTATITATSVDGGKSATCAVEVIEAYVDLGLSVYWATCNLGAESPEEKGEQYAWGEAESDPPFTDDSYEWGYRLQSTNQMVWYKYYYLDKKITLDLDDDAAYVKLGNKWRIPTAAQCKELINKCDVTLVRYNNKYVYKFTSRVQGYTGKSIYIPFYSDPFTTYTYWTSSLVERESRQGDFAYAWTYDGLYSMGRYYGKYIRPVRLK